MTYWDRLGWKDPFSLRAATARQAGYGARFGDGSYTPEMVVDGAVGLVGSHRAEVGAAVAAAKAQGRTAADVRISRSDAGVADRRRAGRRPGQLLLIGFDHEAVTPIARGENGGRTFVESNVVRSVSVVGQWSGAALTLEADRPRWARTRPCSSRRRTAGSSGRRACRGRWSMIVTADAAGLSRVYVRTARSRAPIRVRIAICYRR